MMTRQQKEHLIQTYRAFVRLFLAYLADKYGVRTEDKDKWVTMNDAHVLIDSDTGEIKAGLNDKYTGQKVDDLKEKNSGDKNRNFIQEVDSLIDKALNRPNERQKVNIGPVSEKLLKEAKKYNYDLFGYSHDLDVSGVRHAFLNHGNPETERKRGQIAITEQDIKKIPNIIDNYDNVSFKEEGIIIYEMKDKNGTNYYLEEIRTGRKTLTIKTLYKKK